jgi:site-specific DNA recombinase
MTTKAAVYLRISLDASGDGLAIERQREDWMSLLGALPSKNWE